MRGGSRASSAQAKASEKPTPGEITVGMTTFSKTESHCTTNEPANPAPTRPPMRACEEEDGIPNHQVIRFQPIAPTSAANTTTKAAWELSPVEVSKVTIFLAIVSATDVPSRAPMKFITAAIRRAARGVRALVETEVAIALAAS